MYRTLCVVLVLIAVSESIFDPDDLATCKEINHISAELEHKLIWDKFDPEMDDQNGQCFVACVMQKLGMLRFDGTINPKVVIGANDIKNEAEATIEIEKCSDQPGEGCQKNYNSAVCLERTVDRIKSQMSG